MEAVVNRAHLVTLFFEFIEEKEGGIFFYDHKDVDVAEVQTQTFLFERFVEPHFARLPLQVQEGIRALLLYYISLYGELDEQAAEDKSDELSALLSSHHNELTIPPRAREFFVRLYQTLFPKAPILPINLSSCTEINDDRASWPE